MLPDITSDCRMTQNASAHIFNCRQPFVSHAIQFRGEEKGEMANAHNENNSNN